MKNKIAARITDCVILWYRTRSTDVESLFQPEFVIETFGGWAFWNVSLCRIRIGGVRFCHAVCSILTSRGLYVVNAEADKISDGLPLHFGTKKSRIRLVSGVSTLEYFTSNGVIVRATAADVETLNPGSCFQFVDEAWEFLNHRNTSFSFNPLTRTVRTITESADREFSHETPLRITEARLDSLQGADIFLETAVHISPFDVEWTVAERCASSSGGVRIRG